jgi:hypothetical protein
VLFRSVAISGESALFESPRMQSYLAGNAQAIQLLYQAAQQERCNWGLDYDIGIMDMHTPHLSQVRDSARLLAAHARACAHAGDHAEAARAIKAIYALARHLESDHLLICGLVAVALCHIADQTVEAIVLYDTPRDPEAVARYRSALWLDRRPNERAARIAEAEARGGEYLLDTLAQNGFSKSAGAMLQANVPLPNLTTLGFIFYGSERRCYSRVMADVKEKTRGGELFEEGVIERLVQKHQRGPVILCWLLLPVWERAAEQFRRSQDSGLTTDAGLACLLFQLRHGRDPESLSDLVPDFLPHVPRDAFRDQPLRLRLDPEGTTVRWEGTGKSVRRAERVLRVYSLGANGLDEMGMDDWRGEARRGAADHPDDTVFCLPPYTKPEARRASEARP